MLAHCTLKIYVPGGVRAEGQPYHADDGSFVLMPSRKTRWVGAGQWVARIQNMLRRTKEISLVVRGSMSCRFSGKQENDPFIWYLSTTVIYHTVSHEPFAGIQAMANDGLWCHIHLMVDCVPQTKRHTRLFLTPGDEWWFPSSLCGDCWSKMPGPSIVNGSREFVTLWGSLQGASDDCLWQHERSAAEPQ